MENNFGHVSVDGVVILLITIHCQYVNLIALAHNGVHCGNS
jgi:hypothetical protein